MTVHLISGSSELVPSRSRLVRTLAACRDFCSAKGIPEQAVIADVDPVALF